MTDQPALSVVIPVFNEEGNIERLYSELGGALDALDKSYEVIVVDDGSRDASFPGLKAIHERDPRWQVIRFRRNFGQTAAMSAGFAAARAPIVITIDADLQNDPKDIHKLLDKMAEGYDIVSGWRTNRKENFVKRRLPSMIANGLISRTTGVHLHDYGCTLKVYAADVVKNVRLYGELHRFIPALASEIGVIVAEVPVNDRARIAGKSKYGIGRTFRVILDLLTVNFMLSYSRKPLQVFGSIGLILGGVGVLIGLYLTYVRLVLGQNIGERPLLLLAALLVILGVQMISIGLVAEMVTRTYHETLHKTTYTIREWLHDEQPPAAENANGKLPEPDPIGTPV
jgi:glycosyltransferase involved in cell wall biosynthesis